MKWQRRKFDDGSGHWLHFAGDIFTAEIEKSEENGWHWGVWYTASPSKGEWKHTLRQGTCKTQFQAKEFARLACCKLLLAEWEKVKA